MHAAAAAAAAVAAAAAYTPLALVRTSLSSSSMQLQKDNNCNNNNNNNNNKGKKEGKKGEWSNFLCSPSPCRMTSAISVLGGSYFLDGTDRNMNVCGSSFVHSWTR